jgi:hypothetical protein
MSGGGGISRELAYKHLTHLWTWLYIFNKKFIGGACVYSRLHRQWVTFASANCMHKRIPNRQKKTRAGQ